MNNTAKIIVGGALGYSLFWLASHPTKSPIRRKLPTKRIKNVTVLPEIKIHSKDSYLHLHHWFNLASLYLVLLSRKRARSKVFHGFMLGSILQGLSYKDRFIMRKRLWGQRHHAN